MSDGGTCDNPKCCPPDAVNPQPDGQAPVSGYTKQSDYKVALVNRIKAAENALGDLRAEAVAAGADPRMAAHARTQLQDGFMWLVRSIFQPESRL